jgi:hypothetical protein
MPRLVDAWTVRTEKRKGTSMRNGQKKQREPLSLLRSGLLKASRSHCGPILEHGRVAGICPGNAMHMELLEQESNTRKKT